MQCKTLITEVLTKLSFTTFDDIKRLIDDSSIFANTISVTRNLLEESNYKQELLMFLPKFGLDAISLGAYSQLEMLYKILKKQFKKENPNNEFEN